MKRTPAKMELGDKDAAGLVGPGEPVLPAELPPAAKGEGEAEE